MNGVPNQNGAHINGHPTQPPPPRSPSRSTSNPAPQPTLPYAFAAQFEAIERHENALYAIHPRHVTFRIPPETHVGSPMAPRPPYQHQSPTRPLSPHPAATDIAAGASTPAQIRSRANSPTIERQRSPRSLLRRDNTVTHLSANVAPVNENARPGLQRTSSNISNPEGFSQEMNATAIAMLEQSSVEDVMRFFRGRYPELRDWERVREHLTALMIQFHG